MRNPAYAVANAPPAHDLARRIYDELGENVYLCYQCVRCSSGCPLSEFFDWQPNQVMRALQFAQDDIALESKTPWLCAGCQTCSTRCPQGLDIAAIMEFLTREAIALGKKPQIPEVDLFNKAFLREVRLWGRAFELGLIAELNLRTGSPFANMDLGMKMIRKRKISFLPGLGRPPRRVKPQVGAPNKVAYYPGCSLHSTATEFNHSAQAVCEAVGIELVEPRGWQCCGSTAAHRADPAAAVRLPLENLALMEQEGFREASMPCAACFNRHKAAIYEIRHNDVERESLAQEIGYDYQDTILVRNMVDTVLEHAGVEGVRQRVRRPLEGLRLVCYYGCLLTRPPEVTEAPHPENPTGMDELMASLGAEVLDWSYKTDCCGASHSLTRPDIVLKLSSRLIEHAREAGADVIAVACPLCHTNLDARQFQMNLDEPMPVLYFTQLMAVAFGMEEHAVLQKNLVDPRPLLKQVVPA